MKTSLVKPTASPSHALPNLQLSVQYAVAAPWLTRARLRSWTRQTLQYIGKLKKPPIPALEKCLVCVTIRLVDEVESQYLNHQYRGKDYPTNILTFADQPEKNTLIADLAICVAVLEKEANEQNKTPLAHACHLTVHGVLHALGYDHEVPAEAELMEALEIEILKKMRISNPYLS
jgi:probable rRNA maturation factor